MPGGRRRAGAAVSAVERYEKVRADWLLAHEASWHMSDRRMANELKRRAAQKDRSAAGAAESSHHEGQIKPIASRFVAGGEDSKETMARGCFLVLFVVPAVLVGLGPALAVSHGAYAVTTETRLQGGKVPTRTPWLITAAALAAVGAIIALVVPSLLTVATMSYYPRWVIDVHWAHVGLVYGWLQLVLGLALTAWQIRRHGWPGVTVKSSPKTPGVPDLPTARTASRPTGTKAPKAEAAAPKAPAIPRVPAMPTGPGNAEYDDEAPEFDDEIVIDEEFEETAGDAR